MSNDIAEYEDGFLVLTQFSGGARGVCLQITTDDSHISVSHAEAKWLRKQLDRWLKSWKKIQ